MLIGYIFIIVFASRLNKWGVLIGWLQLRKIAKDGAQLV